MGTDELKVHRLYEYKNMVVMVLGKGISEKNIDLVIYRDGMQDANLPIITTLLEFCNHAKPILSIKEIKRIEEENNRTLEIDETVVTDSPVIRIEGLN